MKTKKIILFFLIFASNAFAGNYGYHPASHLYLGGGTNPFKPDENYLECIQHEGEKQLDTNGAVSTEVEMKLLEKREDFYKTTSFSASMSGSYAFMKGEGSVSSLEEINFHSDSLTWIILFKSDYGKFGLKNPVLVPEYRGLISESLYDTCGSEIVTMVRKGVMAFAVITIHHLSESKKSELKTKFGASAKGVSWGAKVEAQYNSLVQSAMASSSISVAMRAVGGKGIIDLQDLLPISEDLEKPAIEYGKIPSVLRHYIGSMTKENAAPMEYSTVKLKAFVRDLPLRFDNFLHKQIEELYFKYIDFKVTKDRVQHILNKKRDFSPTEIEVLNSVTQQCYDGMNKVYDAAQECLTGDAHKCNIPREPIPYVNFYKYQDKGPSFTIETYCDNNLCSLNQDVKVYKERIGKTLVLYCKPYCEKQKTTSYNFRNCINVITR